MTSFLYSRMSDDLVVLSAMVLATFSVLLYARGASLKVV